MIKKIVCIIVVIFMFIPYFSCSALDVSASAYILYDPQTEEILASRNAKKPMTMASTTKIMTGLILLESGNLDKIVKITDTMVKVEGTSIGLQKGDEISRINLAYGLLLESGNDAANSIAIDIAGSIPAFAKLMNKKAAKLKMTNTNFVTPSGLDAKGHTTTAHDMALLAAAAMKNDTFKTIVSSKSYSSVYNNKDTRRTYYNHNRLLSSVEGVEGIKTGFTKKSGRCLVSSCMRDNYRLIAVTLNAPDDWDDHEQMYSYGFDQYEKVTLGGTFSIKPILVAGGTKRSVAVKNEPIEVLIKKGTLSQISYIIEIPAFTYAPVEIGKSLGEVKFIYDDKIFATSPFTTIESSDILKLENDNMFTQIVNWFLIILSIK